MSLVQVGQQSQAVLRHKPVGLNACLVLVKPHVGVQPCHADVHAGLAVDVARVVLAKTRLVQHVFGKLNDVDVVVGLAVAGHGVRIDAEYSKNALHHANAPWSTDASSSSFRTMPETLFYPIGTPGQPWGAAERDLWRARQVRQRSHADDVLSAIDALRGQWDVEPYGEVARGQFAAHIDLHETTDTDESEYRPAVAARDGKVFEPSSIPDGFYLVDDSDNPQPAFQQAIIDAVSRVTHIAPADDRNEIIGSPVVAPGVIRYAMKQLGLCASISGARYTTTTEVYPDSPRATPEQCIEAQVAAACAAVEFVLADAQR